MTEFQDAARDAAAAITMHKLAVERTARYATAGADVADATTLWVIFHGYGQLASEFMTTFARLAPSTTRVLAPEGLSRFYLELPRADGKHLARTGATWLTRDDREDDLRDALGMLHAVVGQEVDAILEARGDVPAIKVFGFSQGVAMSMRWVADVADRGVPEEGADVATHVLWAGGLAHDVSDDAMRAAWTGTAVQVVVGDKDKFATDSFRRSLRKRIDAMGILVDEFTFGGGHRLDDDVLRQLLR
ncbi:alpha/beta hydrolase [Gemmatimonas sp.]|uniref:alpha/beta hydrolase n=1 Tax=Gemmatimonas sp. TaxID=1962908 RepID=UPI0035678D65